MTSPTPPQAELTSLRALIGDRYLIERELGRGGMGAVYLVRDVKLDRLVAIKVLPPAYAAQPMLRDRFLRETRTTASFSHPNIVPVYAVEESVDLLAYAMGYVEGESLMERVRRAGPLTIREAVKVMQDVAYALGYAHGRGIVHRDIKPDNIMIERASGRALVMDFGIARAKSTAPMAAAGLTRVGEVVGTPEYMSPEQASGDDVDGRSDLYSLGLTLMFALTGRIIVSGETTQKVLVKQLTEKPPSIATLRGDLPQALALAIDRCVLKNPEERFDTAERLVDALDAAQLTTPEIPLAVRLFAQEAGTLSLIAIGTAFAVFYILRTANPEDDAGTTVMVVLIFAIFIARFMQTLKEAGRLAAAGFTPTDIATGLTRVVDERAARRHELKADASVVKARRRTIIAAAVMMVLAVVFIRVALLMRVEIKPGYFSVGFGAMTVLISAVSLFGVSLVLLLKSPLRMPVGERFFRAVWLGGFGRAFVRLAGRGARARNRGESSVVAVAVAEAFPVVAAGKGSVESRLKSVEQRLAALESRGESGVGSRGQRS